MAPTISAPSPAGPAAPLSSRPGALFASLLGGALTAFALLRAPAAVAANNAPPRIAVVDTQRAVLETEDGLRAQATLRKFFDRRQGELMARKDEIDRKKEDLERQSKVLSQAALQRAMADLQQQATDLQSVFMDYNRELQRKQGEVTAPMFGKVSGILRKIAIREGYDVILDKQAVPYTRADLDLTDMVIQMYNSGDETPAIVPSGLVPIPQPAPQGSAPAPARSR